jgi:hypothetical protein
MYLMVERSTQPDGNSATNARVVCPVCHKTVTAGLSTVTTRDSEIFHFVCVAAIIAAKSRASDAPARMPTNLRQLLARQYREDLDRARGREHRPIVSNSIDAAVMNVVASFLEANEPRVFCHTCLAEYLGMTFADAQAATAALRLRRRFVVEIGGVCSVCRMERITLRVSGAAGAGSEERCSTDRARS